MGKNIIRKISSNHHIVLWLIFIIGLILRGYGLSEQPPTDDETAAASAASNYLKTGLFGRVMWYHPPLRNIVVFLSGKLFGEYTAWGLRFGSIMFGSLTVPVLGYIAQGLFKDRRISYLAAFFLCVDPLHISLSREAFQETTTSFFLVAGVLAAYYGIRKDSILYCYLSGILFGISSASKWHGLFPWAVSAMAYLAAPWLIDEYKGERSILPRTLNVLTAYIAIPIVVYIAVHIPWLYRGYALDEFVGLQIWLAKHQYYYKSSPYTEDFLSHRAYQWFLWPVAWVDFVFHQGKSYLSIAMGNFAVWVLTLPSLYFSFKSWFKAKSFSIGYVIMLFLISYLPLVLAFRRSIWVFAAPAVIPFAFLLSAYTVSSLMNMNRLSRKALAIYLAVVVMVSAVLYPLATFKALEYSWAKPLAEMYSPHRGERIEH